MEDKKNQCGQSLVEFLLSLFGLLTILFMVVQISISFGVANYIQYAVFMASRAYLSGHSTTSEKSAAAEAVLEVMMRKNGKDWLKSFAEEENRFIGKSPRVQLQNNDRARDTAWEQGVSYKFRSKLYMLPILSAARRGKDSTVLLESESWLGSDPTEEECLQVLKYRKSISAVDGIPDFIFDNGC